MDPPPKRRGRPRKSAVVPTNQTIETTKPNEEPAVPKIENLLTMNTTIVPQRKAAKARKRYKEASSGEEYVNEDDDDNEEEEDYSDDDVERPSRRSSAAKRKSIAIQSKDQTESWGNYRNTIDNGPVPQHPLTLNETAFDVALKLQHRNQERTLAIDYLDQENPIEFIEDAKMTEQVLLDTYSIQLSQNTSNDPMNLQPFESTVHKNNTFTLNTGIGPIQSLDWLSMPTSKCPSTHQYLAVGCSRSSLISKHYYDETYSYKNYLQIWMFDLSNTKERSIPIDYQLTCLITINECGAIWTLKWSPSGSSTSSYLAAGTSSGFIYLYKIFSEQFPSLTKSSNNVLTFYKSTKSIRLSLTEPNNHTQCLAIDWAKHDPNHLTACYSNGFIALFHVNTDAKYLTEINSNQEKTIFPIRIIRASYTPIRDIKFLSDSSTLVLIIANIAKRFTIWDFDDHYQPLIDIENTGTESVVRTLTGDLLCAKEFTPSYARTSAYLTYEPETNNLSKHIYFQSTPDHVLSVDYSPWLDSILLCDSNGQVYFFRITNFVRWTRKNECSLKYRLKLFNLNAVIKSDKQEEIAKANQEAGEPIFEQASYTDLVDKYYLDGNLCCDQKFVSKQDDFSKAGSYALNALHKIRFNPNLGSYFWYAFGGESGLLFILPLKQSWSNYAISIYEKENKST